MPTKSLVAITGWTSPERRYKERIKAIKVYDHRYSESRVVDEALADYLPRLELRVMPTQHGPARHLRKAAGG